jgi:hypothetical protein
MFLNKFIFFKLKGGLGNQLFIYFTAYLLEKKFKKKALFSTDFFLTKQRSAVLDKLFYRNLEIIKFNKINKNFYKISLILDKIIFFVFSRILTSFYYCRTDNISFDKKILNKKYLYYNFHFLDFKYLIKYRPSIRKIINFDNIKQREIVSNLEKCKKNKKKIVMIHVRRGDTIKAKGYFVSLNYYQKAMKFFKNLNVQFVLFSDSPIWCSRQDIFKNLTIAKEKDAAKTLIMMKLCDHFIISNSTLSCWAAFLGEKKNSIIIYPDPSFIGHSYLQSTLFPKNWIGLKY